MSRKSGQSSIEYSTLIIILIGAFIAGGVYFKRGVQGRWKAAVDDIGDQYDPRYTNTGINFRVLSNMDTRISTVETSDGYWTMREDYSNTLEIKSGTQRIGTP
jgi:hypothetical protein